MGSRRREPKRNSSSTGIPSRDMLHEILLKLPTKHVIRSSCVSKLWRKVACAPSFRSRHAMASHVTSARTEALLVTERHQPGRSDEASVFNASSGKAMCCVPIPAGYGLANVCNGFLCFVHAREGHEAPAVVCNPATGETVALPNAPPLITSDKNYLDYIFSLGFSPSTGEYKLFRLLFRSWSSSTSSEQRFEVDVYTLGDTRGWRRHSFDSPCCPSKVSAPVSIHGKLYMVTVSWTHHRKRENPTRLLAIDVATELCCTYNLPDYETVPYEQPMVGAFELNGRLCFAAHITNFTESMKIHFWVMSPPPEGNDPQQPSWDLRYSFHMLGHHFYFSRPGCWLDDDQMLCYLMDETLHKYDTTKCPAISNGGCLQWDKKLHLPAAPSRDRCLWNVCGGYRPTLLSPLSFALPPSQGDDENKHQFEHDVLSTIRL